MWRDIKLHLAAECIDRGNPKTATTKVNGRFPKISPMLGNMDSSLDKKLF